MIEALDILLFEYVHRVGSLVWSELTPDQPRR
jgi:hypothetical protein